MRRRPTAALTAFLAALLAAAPAALAIDAATLKAKLAREAPRLGGASGVLVYDLDDDRVLYERNAGRTRIPASNQKLFVTAAALLRLGPDATFGTTLAIAPDTVIDEAGVLDGDLFLVGGGDPALDDRDLRALSDALGEAGVVKIAGGIVADESAFDSRRGGPRFRWRPDPDMGGWLSALAWGHGRAGRDGPALHAAQRLHAILKTDEFELGRQPRAGAAPDPRTELGSALSPPLSELAAIVNVGSDNFYAEMLVKGLARAAGKKGTTTRGLSIMRTELGKLSVRPRLADGSGLSRSNRTSPRQVVRLLERMHDHELGDEFKATLPLAGRTGTITRRMRGTAAAGNCRAKTGTINHVSALSGYCTSRDGGTVAFSLLSNRVCTPCAKRVEDRIAAQVARYDG